jgi:hypothetical protein
MGFVGVGHVPEDAVLDLLVWERVGGGTVAVTTTNNTLLQAKHRNFIKSTVNSKLRS